MAPKYKIKSISQALTYLGTRELHQWISMLMMGGIRSEDNSELVVMSLIRGKLMALVAQEIRIADAGAEPFFTGLFSLIDVILNRDMNTILIGLPLPDNIKTALLGGGNILSELLDFIVCYEQADWRKLEGKYLMSLVLPERMVTLYIEAHKWARLVGNQA
jgi:c-di-GMP-related signal transduction protein